MSVRWRWAYAVWVALVGAGLLIWPAHQLGLWCVLGVSAAAAVLIGVRVNRPRRPWPWQLVAVGLLLYSAGILLDSLTRDVTGTPTSAGDVASVLYLIAYPAIATAAAGLAWVSVVGRDRIIVLDALIITSGLGLLVWLFLIAPQWSHPDDALTQKLLTVEFPLGDLLIFIVTVGLAVVAWRIPAVLLLVMAATGLLLSDLVLILARREPSTDLPAITPVGWLLFYLGWGLAALHPSMVLLTEPKSVRPREVGPGYQLLLTSFVAVPLTVLFVNIIRGVTKDNLVAAVFLTITLLLVMVRLFLLVGEFRRSIDRGQVILDVSASMFNASDEQAVLGILRSSVDDLLPRGIAHITHVDQPRDGSPPVVGMLPELSARPVYVRDLPFGLRTQMQAYPLALVCPLAVPGDPTPPGGARALVVAAAERWLIQLQTALEILAIQAAVALDRLATAADLDRRHSEQYFQTLVRHTADVILITEPDRETVRYASPSAAGIFGTDALAGRSVRSLIQPALGQPAEMARSPGPGETSWTAVTAGPAPTTVEPSWQDLRDDPSIHGFVLTLRDVTAQRALQDELTELAYHDPLTGLANRALFSDRVHAALTDARDTGRVVGVLYVDLDDFKMVNDSYGHQTGDALLQAAARRLTATIRPADLAARLGGDEFAVLVGPTTSAEAIEAVAGNVVTSMSQPFLINGRMLPGAASIGVATSAETDGEADLLRHADQAQYAAKSAGKRQWRRFDPAHHGAMLDRLALRGELAEAINGGGLTVEYQPIVELATGAIVGFEALTRWDHPIRGRLGPDQFIDLAEDSGLIVALGKKVLATAVDTAASWQGLRHPGPAPYISVNVSVRQFRDPGFTATVQKTLSDARLAPQHLMLEITESLLLHDDDNTWQTMAELRSQGIRIAIDDFGTGYSALSYLRQVPLDALKIDRAFTSTITSSTRQAALVDVIITLAHTINLDVIAEGIETESERDLLLRFGCRYGQGYLFDRPLSSADATSRVG